MKKTTNISRELFLTYARIYLGALLLLFLVVLGLFYNQQYQKTQENQKQIVSKTSEQIDVSLQNMDRIANGLLFNNTFLRLMKKVESQQQYDNAHEQILNTFTALDAPLFSTHRLIAFNDSYYFNLSKAGENQTYLKNAISVWPYKEELMKRNGQKLFIPTHQDDFDYFTHLVYSVARPVNIGNQNYGFIEIQNDAQRLDNICSMNPQNGQIALFSPEGQIIYPTNCSQEETKYLEQLFSDIHSISEDSLPDTIKQIYSKQKHISLLRSDYSGWTTVLYCSVAQMVPNTLHWILIIFLLFTLIAVSFMLAIRIATDRMSAPLVDLNKALKNVSLDNLSVQLPQQYDIEEIKNINQSFLTMFEHLKEAMAMNIQARANEERANYLALQSQMNPHMIYNTLGMIESVSFMNGDIQISQLCICFSKMLRYISDFKQRKYTLDDELQHLKNYAVLIQTRYGDALHITMNADPELLSKDIPKFTLQPLVENAVKHGFSPSVTGLEIQVDIGQTEAEWYILIQDNGCGITKERLSEIYAQLRHCDESLSSNQDILNMRIGNMTLSNIYIRCRILFGSALNFTIDNNKESNGCYIRIAVKKEEEHHD